MKIHSRWPRNAKLRASPLLRFNTLAGAMYLMVIKGWAGLMVAGLVMVAVLIGAVLR